MATKRTKYTLVSYGRSTLLCRAMAGSATLTAVARFDHESEAQRVLERLNSGESEATAAAAEGSTRLHGVA